MPRAKLAPKRRRAGKAVPVLGAAGLSLTLAGGAAAAAEGPVADMPTGSAAAGHAITLHEEEIADVSLATFYVFDKENTRPVRPGLRLVMGTCGGCGGCGCSGCGCWTGTYYTSPVFGHEVYPPGYPVRPAHKYVPKRTHVPKKNLKRT